MTVNTFEYDIPTRSLLLWRVTTLCNCKYKLSNTVTKWTGFFLLLFCFYRLWSIGKLSCYWINIQSIPSVQKWHSCQNQFVHRYRQTSTHMHMRGYILHYDRGPDHASPVSFRAKSECDTTYISWELHPPLSSTKLPLHKVTLELMGHSIKQPVLPIICPKSVKYILNPNCT